VRDHNEELGLYVGGIVLCIPNQSISHNFILQNIWRNIIIGNTEK